MKFTLIISIIFYNSYLVSPVQFQWTWL